MNASSMTLIRRLLGPALALLLLPLVAAGDGDTPLIDKVHNATARYVDINVAFKEGFVVATPCVSGEDTGAMGVHLVLPSRLSPTSLLLEPTQPQALIYEPTADGSWRLVGVEFIACPQRTRAWSCRWANSRSSAVLPIPASPLKSTTPPPCWTAAPSHFARSAKHASRSSRSIAPRSKAYVSA
jgi:hypothetical protein